MGPRLGGRGDADITWPAIRVKAPMLQWGRGSVAAEIRTATLDTPWIT